MNLKTSLLALSVMCGIAILGSPAASAQSNQVSEEKKQIAEDKVAKDTIVTVKSGDTLIKIAKKHKTTYVRLFNANKDVLNPDMIDIGDKIRIPKKEEKLEDRYARLSQAAPVSAVAQQSYITASTPQAGAQTYTATQAAPAYRGSSAGNTYAWGNCTWYVKNMRSDLPNMLGNGGSWAANAAAQGIATGKAARAGAVAEIPGHVMYVESVNGNGTITVSEMNYGGGLGQVNRRTIAATSVSSYIY